MSKNKVTNSEILEAIHAFSDNVDRRFEVVDQRFNAIDERFMGVDQRFEGIDQRFEGIEKRLNRVEALMVTKDYLDDKLADFKGDIIALMKKSGREVDALIRVLRQNKGLTLAQAEKLLAMQPFPSV